MAILTESQISQLLVTAKARRWEALYRLAIVTGMGQSELLGLKCTDLGWIKQTLRVECQLVLPDGNGVLFSASKTVFGKCSIVLGGMSIELLRKHYDRQHEERIAAREGCKELGLIYTTKIGTPIDKHNLIRSFKMLLKQAGIAPVRFHDLRYT